MGLNVLVIGNGGREHAIAWKLAQSSRIDNLYVAPGNGGTCQVAENVAIDPTDIGGLVQFAATHRIDLTVVGPDEPLVLGIVDSFEASGLRIFGPTQSAAEIEASKTFAKLLMQEVGVPTAKFRIADDCKEALKAVRYFSLPVVVKASGLTKGKGAHICHTLDEADAAITWIMIDRRYGDAGRWVIIEEFLYGQEISIHTLSDGSTSLMLPPAQDHKPIFNGDRGKNSGGMGTIVPVPWVTPEVLAAVEKTIVQPTLTALMERGRLFKGLLYPGLKITSRGPKVLEFNARFGDPETQSHMRLLKTDLLDLLEACVEGTLEKQQVVWHAGYAVCIVLASGGYPDEYATGFPIHGVAEAESRSGVTVFHAGTTFDGKLKTSGGRVLGVTATGGTLSAALNSAYTVVQLIQFEGMQYRNDIGAKAL